MPLTLTPTQHIATDTPRHRPACPARGQQGLSITGDGSGRDMCGPAFPPGLSKAARPAGTLALTGSACPTQASEAGLRAAGRPGWCPRALTSPCGRRGTCLPPECTGGPAWDRGQPCSRAPSPGYAAGWSGLTLMLEARAGSSGLPLTCCVTVKKQLNLSEP